MRRLLVGLVVLVAILVAADFGLRLYTERWVAGELAAVLDVPERPSVAIDGFPFVVRFLAGEFPSATAESAPLRLEGITFRDVEFTLRDVRFPPGDVLGGEGGVIRARTGRGSLSLTGRQASEALSGQGVPVTVRIEGGEVFLSTGQLPQEVQVDLAVNGNELEIRSAEAGLPVTLSLGVPAFVEGLVLTDVRVEGSAAILDFRLERPAFRVG